MAFNSDYIDVIEVRTEMRPARPEVIPTVSHESPTVGMNVVAVIVATMVWAIVFTMRSNAMDQKSRENSIMGISYGMMASSPG